jgi:hypothetical protein
VRAVDVHRALGRRDDDHHDDDDRAADQLVHPDELIDADELQDDQDLNLNFTLRPWRLILEQLHDHVEHHAGADRDEPW